MVNLELDVSAGMRDRAWRHENIFVPDADALQALTGEMKYELPEKPRLLLLEGHQIPNGLHYSCYDFVRPGYVPTIKDESDIVVSFKGVELNELNLTTSVARALLGRKRELDNARGRRIFTRIAAGGAAISGVGMVGFHNDLVGNIGAGIFSVGLATAAYFSNRKDPSVPDVSSFAPPIRLYRDS